MFGRTAQEDVERYASMIPGRALRIWILPFLRDSAQDAPEQLSFAGRFLNQQQARFCYYNDVRVRLSPAEVGEAFVYRAPILAKVARKMERPLKVLKEIHRPLGSSTVNLGYKKSGRRHGLYGALDRFSNRFQDVKEWRPWIDQLSHMLGLPSEDLVERIVMIRGRGAITALM
jgi:hypothetical protein